MEKISIKGYLMTFIAYVIWGVLPLYWKQLASFRAFELLAMRIIVTVITMGLVVLIAKQNLIITYFKDPKIRKQLLLTSVLIAINWGVFVFAVNSGYMIQASLGYYMNPLISVLLGIFVLKEKLTKPQYISLILAALGVLYLAVSYGEFPWIALILGLSFALYGLFKKTYHLNSLHSLLLETVYLFPVMVVIAIYTNQQTQWVATISTTEWMILALSGILTAIPLILFSDGAKLIPLSAVGFLQYVAPTLMLAIGVIVYHEAFTNGHKISFALIWSGLLIYSVSLTARKRDLTINKRVLLDKK